MRRPYSPYGSSMSFGPGPLSPAVKGLIIANVAVFLGQVVARLSGVNIEWVLGLRPEEVVSGRLWQLVTYMFLHSVGSITHLLFNMLMLWMFGTELERIWGTRGFLQFYFVTGIGAAVLTVTLSLLPFGFTARLYEAYIIGASGAIFGLLVAQALYFPNRPLLIFMLFPLPMRQAVLVFGAIEVFFSLVGESGVANITHLGGALVAYLYLKSGRVHPLAELKYRYLKWKISRTRAKFDVYDGGRSNDWTRRTH